MNDLNKNIIELRDTLKSYDTRIDDHEKRIAVIEDWREHHDDK